MLQTVDHRVVMLTVDEKVPYLVEMLKRSEEAQTIIFCNSEAQALGYEPRDRYSFYTSLLNICLKDGHSTYKRSRNLSNSICLVHTSVKKAFITANKAQYDIKKL